MESNKSDSDRKLSKSKKRLKKSINRKKINKVKLRTDHDDGRKDQYPKKGKSISFYNLYIDDMIILSTIKIILFPE